MKTSHSLGVAAVALFAAGCAATPQHPELEAEARAPLYCQGADQCSLYWRRAQVWIVTNSHWKIQTATDSVIVTYTTTRSSMDRGYTVLREPMADGREQIKINSGCANMFGCSEDLFDVTVRFKRYVRGN